LIEQDLHWVGGLRLNQAAPGVLQDRLRLFPRDPREPFQKVINASAAFQILKQRDDRNPGSRK